jgi:TRAP-type C4-dicarboxylate transport system permease small subunit
VLKAQCRDRNRLSLTKFAMVALCILAAWTGFAYSLQLLAEAEPASHWRDFVLIALLPALGIAHLLYLATRRVNKLATT